MWNCLVKFLIVLLIECVPWSLINVSGHPNIVMMFSLINSATTSLEHVSTGSTSTHLVTYSIVVIIYLAPNLLAGIGNGPMKSIA